MKIFLDTHRSRSITVDSYDEDGEYIYAKMGTLVRKIALSKIAYIEEDLREKRKETNKPIVPEPLNQSPVNNQPPAPLVSRSFAEAVERNLVRPAEGLKPPVGLTEVDRPIVIDAPSPPRKPFDFSQGHILVKIVGAANASINLTVPQKLIDSELTEELAMLIFSNEEVTSVTEHLAYLKTSKIGNVIEITTGFRKPVSKDSNESIAAQVSNLTQIIGTGVMTKLLPNLPIKEDK